MLGPPKTSFASSRTISKLSDFAGEKGAPSTPSDPVAGDEAENARAKFFRDRDAEKQSNRKSQGPIEKDEKSNRDSWTSLRERKNLGAEEDEDRVPKGEGRERNGRYGRADREKDHDVEPRRSGFGETGPDGRWKRGEAKNGDRPGGWRERERRNERGWGREGKEEKDPEWMDEPAEKEDKQAHTQEEFQKWKERMKAGSSQTEEKENTTVEAPLPAKDMTPVKPAASLVLEGFNDNLFGGWGAAKQPEPATEGAPLPAKAAGGKAKSSRFAGVFATKAEPVEETPVQKVANQAANGSAEDKEGFQRILQMLGGTGLGQVATPNEPTSPPPKSATNGSKPKSRFFDSAKSPEPRLPQAGVLTNLNKDGDGSQRSAGREMTDGPANIFGLPLAKRLNEERPTSTQVPSNPMSPEPMNPANGIKDQRPPSGRPQDSIFLDGPPSRSVATPDLNIQNLLATQRQRPQHLNRDSEFLLNLITTKGQSRPPSQARQTAEPDPNFQLFLDQPPKPHTHAPKPRAAPPPPGFFEDQMLQNVDPPRQEQPQHDMPQRRASQRAPPGFIDDPVMFNQMMQQQNRRTFNEPPQSQQSSRRMSGHPGLSQMQMPQQQQMPPDYSFLQSPTERMPPPPGFNPNVRHPPGFANMPGIFQTPQPSQQGLPQIPRDMQGGYGLGPMGSPPNVPPGFYGGPSHAPGVPPGFMAPHMGMRGPQEGMMAGGRGGTGLGRGFDGFDEMRQRNAR